MPKTTKKRDKAAKSFHLPAPEVTRAERGENEEAVKEYQAECDEIATQCAEEGYPSHGSNYDLRVEALKPYYPEIFGEED